MQSRSESIQITCPFGDGDHAFNLKVQISVYSAMLPEKPRLKRYTRLFTCPKTGQDFQATITLQEGPNFDIETVEVEK